MRYALPAYLTTPTVTQRISKEDLWRDPCSIPPPSGLVTVFTCSSEEWQTFPPSMMNYLKIMADNERNVNNSTNESVVGVVLAVVVAVVMLAVVVVVPAVVVEMVVLMVVEVVVVW